MVKLLSLSTVNRERVMKKLLIVAALGAAGLVSTGVQAQGSTNGNFNVVINLTPACSLSAIPDMSFTYASFQGTAATGTPSNYTVTCTTGLPYTMALDATTTTDNVVNLQYTLALSAAGGTGNGAAQGHQVTGTMPAGQSGTCATPAGCTNATATNRQRTLTVSW